MNLSDDRVQDLNDIETFEVPIDDPGAVLGRLVPRLGLHYTRSFVFARVGRHREPNSLLALVEVAAELGIKVTAARTDAAGLAELNVPAVVHFSSVGGTGGFAVLEGVTATSVHLWDSRSGRRHIDKDAFLAHWSGVVALVERDDSRRVSERGYLQHRLLELLAGSGAPPDFVGSRRAPILRAALGVLVTSLLVIATTHHPSDTRLAALTMMALTTIGLAVTTAMAVAASDRTRTFALPGCPRGKLVNCESVLASPYSRIAGVPLSEIGVAFFGAVLLLIATAAISPGSLSPWVVSGLVYLLAVPIALLLVFVQIFMRQFCTLCLMVHGVIAAGAVVSLPFLSEFQASVTVLASAILVSVYISLILFLVIPHFTRIGQMNSLVASHQRIASSPYATLAHVLTEQPTEVRGTACGIRLDGPPSPKEVVLFVHPGCGQCSRTIEEARSLAAAGRVEVFVSIAPREETQGERDACSALVAVGLALGPQMMLDAYGYAKRDFTALLAGDSVRKISVALSLSSDRIEAASEQGLRLVERTEELARAYVEGTPAVFINSRLYPYTAPISHLSFLLEHHPELLEPTHLAEAESMRATKQVVQT